MINEHVSESDIQLYALTPDAVATTTAAHIEHCDHCLGAVASYQFIFDEIKEAPRPTFDFDLSGLILQQLPINNKTTAASLPIWFWICIPLLVGIPLYIFQADLVRLFKGISIFVIYSIAAATLIILAFRIFEIYRRYQHKMNVLNFS
jgi:hypothetical protein